MLVKVLGPLEVLSGDTVVPLRRGRPRSLLHLLVLNRRVVQPVDVVTDRLWGDDDPVDGPNAVHQLISYLRRSLGPEGRDLLVTTAAGYRFDAADDQLDMWQFEALVQSTIRNAASADAASARRGLADAEAAILLWRGEPFVESAHYEWTSGDRARLQDAYLQAQESRLDALLALGRHREVVLEGQSLTAAYPLRERFHAQLALALYRSGRQSDALDAHRALRGLLAEELGLDPGPELRELERAILGQDPALDWVEPSGDVIGLHVQGSKGQASEPDQPVRQPGQQAAPHPVPDPLLSMLGRERELSVARSRVRPGVIYTMTGPAGVGKTRFAWALASHLTREQQVPVWFVDLSDIHSDDHVPGAVAERMGLTGEYPQDPAERIVSAVESGDGALFLDSCEHVVGAVAELLERLRHAVPTLMLVATSRRPLELPVEQVHPLAPLPVPSVGDDARLLADNVSVQLFCDRARLVKADFELHGSGAADVAAIVTMLDGLPLAIELAAAHCDVSTPRAIRSRLETHLDSLVANSPALPARLRSLAAAIDSSAVLLNNAERRFLYACSVFPGAFEISAAAAVAGVTEEAGFEVLAALVRQSLVSVAGDGRYKLLAPVRSYASSRAMEQSDYPDVRKRHVDWVANLAWESWVAGQRVRQRQVLGELSHLLPDARVALSWALDTEYMWGSARIAVAFSWMWTLHGLAEEGFTWLTEVKALSDRTPEREPEHTLARAALLRSLGLLANPMGRLQFATEVCAEAAKLSLDLGDHEGAAAALLTLGVSQWALGQLGEAADSLDRAGTLMKTRPETWHYVAARVLRARTALDAGEDDAAARLEDAVETAQLANESHMLGLALACQAKQHYSAHAYETAQLIATEALRVWQAIGYTEGEMMALNVLSRCCTALGDLALAHESARKALAIAHSTHHRGAICESVESLALAAATDGRREHAFLLLSVAERERVRLQAPVPAGDKADLEQVRVALGAALGGAVALVTARARMTRCEDLVDELLSRG